MEELVLLKKYALNYLSKYNSTKKNLIRILQKKINKKNLEKKQKLILYNYINDLLLELESKNIINDKNYTDSKIQNFSLQGKSKYYIKNYLLQKGIDKIVINENLENFESMNPNWEYNSAKIFFIKKKLSLSDKKNKEKSLAKMARAGFDYNIIKKTLQ